MANCNQPKPTCRKSYWIKDGCNLNLVPNICKLVLVMKLWALEYNQWLYNEFGESVSDFSYWSYYLLSFSWTTTSLRPVSTYNQKIHGQRTHFKSERGQTADTSSNKEVPSVSTRMVTIHWLTCDKFCSNQQLRSFFTLDWVPGKLAHWRLGNC